MMVRYVGGVEVGGWPVPAVYWYRVLEDGSEEEVSTRTLYCTVLYCTVLSAGQHQDTHRELEREPQQVRALSLYLYLYHHLHYPPQVRPEQHDRDQAD